MPPGSSRTGSSSSGRPPRPTSTGRPPPSSPAITFTAGRADGADKLVNTSLVPETKYEDRDFVYGAPVRYFVRASATAAAPFLESDDSEARELVPEDSFPPAAPAAVVPVTGHGSVSLSWEANHEKDLAGYRVRRREEGGTEDVLLTPGLLLENAFTDCGD